MRLKKAFNNNALLALDDNDEEVIVGKGIGWRIDESLIFVLIKKNEKWRL